VAFALVSTVGCANVPYFCGGCLHTECDAGLKPGEPQVECGRRAPVIDAVGWVAGIPAKLVMLDQRVANHNVSCETELSLQEYLARNGLDKTKVRINQYDPCGEWRRLADNKSVCWPVRYTFGTLSVVGYTLLPGRIFGCDQYNPYTNTISLYSDVPGIGLYLGGHAKDFAQREHKGLYAVAYAVPGLNIYHESQAANDALGYLETFGTFEELRDGYRSIVPAFAARASLPLEGTTSLPFLLPSVLAGHAVGQIKASQVPDQCPPSPATPNAIPANPACAGDLQVSSPQYLTPPPSVH
jgi:hypothetical protein